MIIFMEKSEIAILLGAGSSINAGIPSTSIITDTIIKGRDNKARNVYKYHGNDGYYLRTKPYGELDKKESEKFIEPIKLYIKFIYNKTRHYFNQQNVLPNYEHLFYTIDQIFNSYKDNSFYENPVVQPFINEIDDFCFNLITLNEFDNRINYNTSHSLSQFSLDYIKDIISGCLETKTIDNSYFNFLNLLNDDENFSKINIFTTNHDLVIEDYLEGEEIKYFDGFVTNSNGINYWDYEKFLNNESKFQLLKLHGSINWFDVSPEKEDLNYFEDRNKKFTTKISGEVKLVNTLLSIEDGKEVYVDNDGFMYRAVQKRPILLTGTYNKFKDYNFNIFPELFYHYKDKLLKSKYLIISGYSFGDDSVNSRIIEWFFKNKDNKLLIIDPQGDKFVEQKNYFTYHFSDWIKLKRLVVVNRGLEEVDLVQMMELLNS